MIRGAIEKILGTPLSDTAYTQACLTPKLGGLGLRRTTEHASFAFQASWYEAKATSKEEGWDPPDGVEEGYIPQSVASFQFDEQVHASLVEHFAQAGDKREVQRLKRCAQPHASGFITAVPSHDDGKDATMRPQLFRTAVHYRLGIPLLEKEIDCPVCMQKKIDIMGDHATCCARTGDLITRHNALRDMVCDVARQGLMSPVMEKKGILGSSSGRRPGDVTLPKWFGGKGLAMDIAVTSPFAKNHVKVDSPCEYYAQNGKDKKYLKDFEGTDYEFAPIVWESTGALNQGGEEVLRQIMRAASKQQGREHSSYCGRQWALFSCCLQRSVAKQLLMRIDGQNSRQALGADASKLLVEPQLDTVD